MQRRAFLPIGEVDVFEGDCSAVHLKWFGAGPVPDVRLKIQQRENPRRRRKPLLKGRVQIGNAFHRLIGHQQRGDEREEGARRRRSRNHLAPSIEDDEGDAATAQEFHHRMDDVPDFRRFEGKPENVFDDVGGAPRLIVLHSVSLDVPRASEGFIQKRGQPAHRLLHAGRDLAHPPADANDRKSGRRVDEERNQREGPILIKT